MKIGLDYWRVCSHYPAHFTKIAQAYLDAGGEVHIISAIGKRRKNTIQPMIDALGIPYTQVHELIFNSPVEAPQLKLAKCQQLGVWAFYDDRADTCDLLTQHGILGIRVSRMDRRITDAQSDVEMMS